MPYILAGLIALFIGLVSPTPQQDTVTFGAVKAFTSAQLAPSASNGDCLTTDGTNNVWSGCGGGGVSGGFAGMIPAWVNGTTLTATDTPTGGAFYATSTRASVLPYASSTAISTSYASSTFFFGAGLASCSGGNFLTFDGSGRFGCAADSVGGGGSYPFTPLTTFATSTSATTSSIWTQGVFFSSSTKAASQFPYASTTAFSVSGNSFLGTVSSGDWQGTTIGIAKGGTNQTNYPTTGGMIYFDGTKLTQSAGGDPFYDAGNSRFIVGRASGSFRINGVGSNGNGYFGIDSASGITTGNVFLINASGNVGIATTTPAAKLGVTGDMFIAGNITSTSTLASVFPYASTTALTMVTGSTTNLIVSSAGGSGTRCAQFAADGTISAAASACGSASGLSSYDAWLHLTNFATTTSATNTPIWTQGVFFASSTAAASQFPYASTTAITAVTASTTNLYVSGASGALALIGTDGLLGKYGGAAACTNQVVTAISAVGATTCTTITNAMLTSSSVTINTTGIATGGGSVSLGSTITINASSSPTVGFVIATSTRQNSVFPYASTTGVTVSSLLTIPNGTAPVAVNAGDIAHDTSDNMLILDDLVVARATERIWGVTVASTSPYFIGATNLAIPTQVDGYTMTSIHCHVVSGTSKAIQITDGSNATESITCLTTDTTDDGSITNAGVTANELMYIDFGATSGAVDTISISVHGQWTRE